MNKISLNEYDKHRLSELIIFLLDPSGKFAINSKGEVYFGRVNYLTLIFSRGSDDHHDFYEIIKMLINKIIELKGESPFVRQLCDSAIESFLETNDRATVIKSIYTAYTLTEEPQQGSQDEEMHFPEIKIETQEQRLPLFGSHTIFEQQKRTPDLARDVAALLNQAKVVFIKE
jgi:hypothetical protein